VLDLIWDGTQEVEVVHLHLGRFLLMGFRLRDGGDGVSGNGPERRRGQHVCERMGRRGPGLADGGSHGGASGAGVVSRDVCGGRVTRTGWELCKGGERAVRGIPGCACGCRVGCGGRGRGAGIAHEFPGGDDEQERKGGRWTRDDNGSVDGRFWRGRKSGERDFRRRRGAGQNRAPFVCVDVYNSIL
jgi:hypothetical protein